MNLASKTWGGTDQAYKTLITKPAITSTIGSGYQLQDGEGTALPIYLGSDGFGVINGSGFRSSITTSATSNRTLTFSDASGRVSPELYAVLSSDATNSTTSPSAISSFGVTLEVSAIYEFEIVLRCQSAATATGIRTQITGPSSQVDWTIYDFEVALGNSLTTPSINRESITTLATVSSPATSPVANTDFLVRYRGLLKTTGVTPASDIGVSFHSETGSSQVTVKSGSFIRFRKIN